MADGNMGKLFFELGVKDRTSTDLNRVLKTLQATDGSVTKLRSALEEYKKTLNGDDLKDFSNGVGKAIKNALDYLSMLQRIDKEKKKIAEMKSLNNGVDTEALKQADAMLTKIKHDLYDLQSAKMGGVDNADLTAYQKTLRNTLEDVKRIERSFDKQNSLSDSKSNQAKFNKELEVTANKLKEIYALQSKGMRMGYDVSSLLSAGNTLRGVKKRTESILADEASLSNMAKVKSLISDIDYAYAKATAKIKEYRIASQEASSIHTAESQKKSELAKIESLLNNINRLEQASKGYGVDTSRLSSARHELESLMSIIQGLSEKKLLGIGFKDAINDLRVLKTQISDVMREQSAMNRSAKAQSTKLGNDAQREIRTSVSRINALSDALARLKNARATATMLKVDTSEIDRSIRKVQQMMYFLANTKAMLGRGNLDAVGRIGNIGGSRDVQLINRDAAAFEKANKEAQRGIELEQRRKQEIVATAAKARNDLASAMAGVNREAQQMRSILGDVKSLFLQGGIVFGAQQLFNSIVKTGGEIVQQHIALRSILGSVAQADKLFEQTQQLALQSPFKFGELNRDTKQLAAFGVEAKDLYETTKRIADIASGLGVDFGRLGLAFGQVKARSWLDGKELRQFAYAGLPLLEKITELYNSEGKNGRSNYTQGDVKKMISNREVSFEDVKKVLWNLTDEGGQFYNMQFVLSETLLGKWNKLIDAWEIMLGKFAEGNNIVGGSFKLLISGATEFVLAIDKISTSLLAMGAVRMVKSLGGALVGNAMMRQYETNMNLQLRAYAIEQQQAVVEGKITQEIALQNVQKRAYLLADKQSVQAAYTRLALEGKLNIVKMQTLVRQKMLTPELIKQLTVMGLINAKQEQTILNGTRLAAVWSVVRTKMSTALSFVGGWAGITFGAVAAVASNIYNHYEKIEEKANAIQEESANMAKKYEDMLSLGDPENKDDMKKRVKDMKSILIDSGEYTKTISEQVAKAKDLNEQYDILHEAIVKARDAASQNGADADIIAAAIGNTGGGWDFLNDSISENIQDLEGKANKFKFALSSVSHDVKTSMEEIANSMLPPRFAAKSLEEKIRELAYNGDIKEFERRATDANKKAGNSIHKISRTAEGTADAIREIVHDDVPKIISSLQNATGRFGDDFALWCKENPDRFQKMLLQMASSAEWLIPQITDKLYQLTGYRFTEDKGKDPLQDNDIQRFVRSRLKGDKGKYEFIKPFLVEDSWHETRSKIKSELQKQYEEIESRSSSGADAKEKQASFDKMKQIALEALNYDFIPEGKKSQKTPKSRSSQEDQQLKDLRERISLYKKMYNEIKKFESLYGDGALDKLRQDGEFSFIFSDRKKYPITDYTDYKRSIEQILGTVPANTNDRRNFVNEQKVAIQQELRKKEQEDINDSNNALSKQLNLLAEQYEMYKRLYELTGDKQGAMSVAFGGIVQSDTIKDALLEQMRKALPDANAVSKQNYTAEQVLGMTKEQFDSAYGENSKSVSVIFGLYQQQIKKLKKESVDLLAELISKNTTIEQQIKDENRAYERQREIINSSEINDEMKKRSMEGLDKTHNEKIANLQFEQFKQQSDWVSIFDELSRVSSATIDEMIGKIDEFSKTTGLSVEVVKQLRSALDKLRKEQIDRNPIPFIFGGVSQGNAIGSYLGGKLGEQYKMGSNYVLTDTQASKMGLKAGVAYSKNQLRNAQAGAYNSSSTAISKLAGKMQALTGVMQPVVDLFRAMGEENSLLGQITSGANGALSSAAGIAGNIDTLSKTKGFEFLSGAGPYAAAAAAALSIGGSLIKAFGADYASYNKAKAEYNTLSGIWDSLISKKTQYMNIHWGTESQEAAEKARKMLKAEIEQTKVIAKARLESGASAGSHSIGYRMWAGSYKYNGQNWKDIAPSISRRYGVSFNGIEDLLNMNHDVLERIKTDYAGFWATLDSDYRDYLDKLIQYGDQEEEIIDNLTEKLTGNKFSNLVSAWGSAMSQMANSSSSLLDSFEDNLKNTILNSMVENVYGNRIKALLEKSKNYAQNGSKVIDSATGKVLSEYTEQEYSDMMNSTKDIADDVKATRDYLKKLYGWTDNSSSSSRNSVNGINEEQADILISYVNAMRLDLSVVRSIKENYYPEMSEVAKAQLSQLNLISQNTKRNADTVDRIEAILDGAIRGTKKFCVK